MRTSISISPALGRLSADAQDALARCGRPVTFARHARLVGPGAAPAVHLLVRGLAKRCIACAPGRHETVWLVVPGELVGTASVLPRAPERDEVVALERVETLAFAPRDLLSLGRAHPEIFLALAEHYAERIRRMAGQALEATTEDVFARLARLLLEIVPQGEAGDGDGFVAVTHRLTHQTLAQAVGASRPYTTIVLRDLERRGALRREGRDVYVQRDTLRAIALSGAES